MAVLIDQNTKVICQGLTGTPCLATGAGLPIATMGYIARNGVIASGFWYRCKGIAMRIATFCLLAFALAACETTTSTIGTSPASPGISRSANAGPGARGVSSDRATQIFAELCVRHAPGFGGTEVSAAANGFVQNAGTGAYYHQQDNLSVKLTDGRCSMVFSSKENAIALESAFEKVNSNGRKITFSPGFVVDGSSYYRAFIR